MNKRIPLNAIIKPEERHKCASCFRDLVLGTEGGAKCVSCNRATMDLDEHPKIFVALMGEHSYFHLLEVHKYGMWKDAEEECLLAHMKARLTSETTDRILAERLPLEVMNEDEMPLLCARCFHIMQWYNKVKNRVACTSCGSFSGRNPLRSHPVILARLTDCEALYIDIKKVVPLGMNQRPYQEAVAAKVSEVAQSAGIPFKDLKIIQATAYKDLVSNFLNKVTPLDMLQ